MQAFTNVCSAVALCHSFLPTWVILCISLRGLFSQSDEHLLMPDTILRNCERLSCLPCTGACNGLSGIPSGCISKWGLPGGWAVRLFRLCHYTNTPNSNHLWTCTFVLCSDSCCPVSFSRQHAQGNFWIRMFLTQDPNC